MNRVILGVVAALVWAAACSAAFGLDQVQRRSGQRAENGTVAAVSKETVTVKVRTSSVQVPAGDVAAITFTGEPPALNLARSAEKQGNFDFALEKYREAVAAKPKGLLAGEVAYLIARTTAAQAMGDHSKLPEAARLLEEFLEANPDTHHYYPLHEWLATVYLEQEKFDDAQRTYLVMQQSQWKEFQLRSLLGQAAVLQRRKDFDGALSTLDRLIGESVSGTLEELCRREATLANGKCLSLKGDAATAEKMLREVIADAPNDAFQLQARAYNLLGDCLYADRPPAQQQRKKALIEYLHVDLLAKLSAHPEEHAKTLYQLSKLWSEVDPPHPERADDALARLREMYPNSTWTKLARSR